MRKYFICLAVIMALAMIGGRAFALHFGDGGQSLQGAIDNITTAPIPGDSHTDVTTDYLPDNIDSYWAIHGSGGSVNTLIIEIAAWEGTNTFGVYDATNSGKKVQVFGGGATSGTQATLSIWADGSVFVNGSYSGIDFNGNLFGYYLNSTVGHPDWSGGIWHSDTSLNVDGEDHMAAYQGNGVDTIQIWPFSPGEWSTDEYILAFEDLHRQHWGDGSGPIWGNGIDPDYSDFVLIVESVDPIPEPATLLLLGLGLVGVAGLNRKKFMG